jgi:hypothetical protein
MRNPSNISAETSGLTIKANGPISLPPPRFPATTGTRVDPIPRPKPSPCKESPPNHSSTRPAKINIASSI